MRRNVVAVVVVMLLSCLSANAQFKEKAFSQSYNDDKASPSDTTDKLFDFKKYANGLAHKGECDITTSFLGSTIAVGGMQIYNRDYWKLPMVYGGIGAGIGCGLYYKDMFEKSGDPKCHSISNAFFIGAGIVYWATLLDGVASYDGEYPLPGKATLYSALLPGLGQIYNREYWKLAIYWGGFVGSTHFYLTNRKNYERFRNIYLEATGNPEYNVPISAETALYYRDVYRRYRDYSVLSLALFYVLQIIDANVFAYMHDFEIDDNISLGVTPSLVTPDLQIASTCPPALGMSFALTF